MKKSSVVKDALILTVITLIAGALLGLVQQVTAKPIEEQQAKTKNAACLAVFENAADFEDVGFDAEAVAEKLEAEGITKTTVNSVTAAKSADGSVIGYVVDVTNSEGYGGDIELMAGISDGGTVNGISFLSISETAGLGMKAKEPEFKDQFSGLAAERVVLSKDNAEGTAVDAISGATVTSKAVLKCVNAALLCAGLMEEAR